MIDESYAGVLSKIGSEHYVLIKGSSQEGCRNCDLYGSAICQSTPKSRKKCTDIPYVYYKKIPL
jgi:hypothetical protein